VSLIAVIDPLKRGSPRPGGSVVFLPVPGRHDQRAEQKPAVARGAARTWRRTARSSGCCRPFLPCLRVTPRSEAATALTAGLPPGVRQDQGCVLCPAPRTAKHRLPHSHGWSTPARARCGQRRRSLRRISQPGDQARPAAASGRAARGTPARRQPGRSGRRCSCRACLLRIGHRGWILHGFADRRPALVLIWRPPTRLRAGLTRPTVPRGRGGPAPRGPEPWGHV